MVGADESRPVMGATEKFVGDGVAEERGIRGDDVAHHDRVSLIDDDAVDQAGVKRGPTSAPAPGLHVELHSFVGQFQQAFGPRKELTPEIGDESERVDIGVESIGHHGKLVGLVDRIELAFVADDVIQ